LNEFSTNLQILQLYVAGCMWLIFTLFIFTGKKPPQNSEKVHDRRSLVGLFLQLLGYLIVWLGLRTGGYGFLRLGFIGDILSAVVAFGVIAMSLYLAYTAVQTLGKHWSLVARLVYEHQLVTIGPYHLVRHPIYTAMLGMLVGMAIAVSKWQFLLIATAIFLPGTLLRIRAEEQLLLAAFGDAYRNYIQTVPALIPRWPRA
jgi:protein-S-isoprenylcysteine O-methyltransferase Ste14